MVLAGIAVAGIAQAGSPEDQEPTEVAVPDSSTATTEPPAAESPPSTTPVPFVYRIGVLSGISTDNFWAYYGNKASVWNSYILGPTKPALYTLDPATGTMTPELAAADASPERNGDVWHIEIPLREDLQWSDGTAITAHDVVFTFQTVRTLGLGGSWADAYPDVISSVHADDASTLRIEFRERPNLSVWPHGVGMAPVMAEHVWADVAAGGTAKALYAASGKSDVSGGPLTLTSVTDALVTAKANPGYVGTTTPDVVEYHVYEDEESLVSAVADGEVDSLLTPKGITAEQQASLEGENSVAVLSSPANGVRYLGFNLTRLPMSEPAFRRALALLLDREGLADQIAHTGEVATAMVPAANEQWFDEKAASSNQQRYVGDLGTRLEKALSGLRKAGYSWTTEPSLAEDGKLVPGEGLTFEDRPPGPMTILTPGDKYDPARPEYVQQIADTLAILGFDTRPVETDFDTVVDLAFTPGDDGELQYDMYMLGWTLGSPTLPDFYRYLFSANGVMNNTGYSSKQFDKALARYENAYSVDDARDALWTMEETLAKDLPYLLLYTSQLTEIYRSDRVAFEIDSSLGGLQGRLGGIGDVSPADS